MVSFLDLDYKPSNAQIDKGCSPYVWKYSEYLSSDVLWNMIFAMSDVKQLKETCESACKYAILKEEGHWGSQALTLVVIYLATDWNEMPQLHCEYGLYVFQCEFLCCPHYLYHEQYVSHNDSFGYETQR